MKLIKALVIMCLVLSSFVSAVDFGTTEAVTEAQPVLTFDSDLFDFDQIDADEAFYQIQGFNQVYVNGENGYELQENVENTFDVLYVDEGSNLQIDVYDPIDVLKGKITLGNTYLVRGYDENPFAVYVAGNIIFDNMVFYVDNAPYVLDGEYLTLCRGSPQENGKVAYICRHSVEDGSKFLAVLYDEVDGGLRNTVTFGLYDSNLVVDAGIVPFDAFATEEYIAIQATEANPTFGDYIFVYGKFSYEGNGMEAGKTYLAGCFEDKVQGTVTCRIVPHFLADAKLLINGVEYDYSAGFGVTEDKIVLDTADLGLSFEHDDVVEVTIVKPTKDLGTYEETWTFTVDLDQDDDSVLDAVDNCVSDANADQADVDGDGIGDVCDPSDDRPTGTSSGSSGGSSGGSDSTADRDNVITCTEIWQCSPWGECVDGIKTTECVDLNSCGTTENKPNTEITCVEAAVAGNDVTGDAVVDEVVEGTGLGWLTWLLVVLVLGIAGVLGYRYYKR